MTQTEREKYPFEIAYERMERGELNFADRRYVVGAEGSKERQKAEKHRRKIIEAEKLREPNRTETE